MKMPKTFVPEKNLEDNVKDLLSGEYKKMPKGFEKVILDKITLGHLKELECLEQKIDHVKVSFNYLGQKHQIVYTPNYDKKEGFLQLLQMSQGLSINMIESIATTLKKTFNTYTNYEMIYQTFPNQYLLMDFQTGIIHDLSDNFKKFFMIHKRYTFRKREKKKNLFTQIRIYVEYNDLEKEDLKQLVIIPKDYWLETSKTYAYHEYEEILTST